MPPITCASWCQYGDGHPGEWHPDDQWCSSAAPEVRLTRMPIGGNLFTVYLAGKPEGSTHARVELHEQDVAQLTLEEVRRLRDNLTALLVLAGSDQ